MTRTSNNQLYAFELDDYSAPSCTSFTKLYFGTIDDFRTVLDNIGEEKMEELHTTFERFLSGERKIIYSAGQCVTRFAQPAQVMQEKEIVQERVSYRYENSYGFFYKVRISKAEGKAALVKVGPKFYIVYWMTATNPRYQGEQSVELRWQPLGGMIWGFPGIISIKGKKMRNQLGVVDSCYKTEQEAVARFESLHDLDWNSFFEDVFGDG